jgi:hypothetical protein
MRLVDVNFDDLVGKTLTKITVTDDTISFVCDDGTTYEMFHMQDCCESVSIESIDGDIQRLIGSPITVAYSSSNSGEIGESSTWTFYTLGTIIDTVSIRWFGESNGYYSEGVDFRKGEK